MTRSPSHLFPAVAAAALAWGLVHQPALAALAVIAVWALALKATMAWLIGSWIVLAGLMILSYGFNNIPLPAGGASAPLVDAFILFGLFSSSPWWWRWVRDDTRTRRIFFLLVFLSAVGIMRLVFDLPRHGVTAARDALYILEAWGVMIGIAAGGALGRVETMRWLNRVFVLALCWFMLYPFRSILVPLGPTVGIQRPTPLLAFTTAGFIAVPALFWFLAKRSRWAPIFATMALLTILMAQLRGAYLALILTPLLALLGQRRSDPRVEGDSHGSAMAVRIGAVAAAVLVVLSVLPPLPGRLGERVSLSTVAAQFETLEGKKGPGSGSIDQRNEAWPKVVKTVRARPLGPIIGVGFGPDLFNFINRQGVTVRKPHNDFLEVWARTGIIGLAPWLLLILSLVHWSLRSWRSAGLGIWLVAFQAMSIVAALTQPFFGFAYGGLVYFLICGLCIGSVPARQNFDVRDDQSLETAS